VKTVKKKSRRQTNYLHHNRKHVKQEEGFTLFELLIALFIGTLLIMAGAYAIRAGLFSMERDEAWFNESAREKAVYDFFWQQASSLRIQEVHKKNSKKDEEDKSREKTKTVYFTGERDFLTFVSPLSLTKHYGQGLIIASYKIAINDKGLWDLTYSERNVNPAILRTTSEESNSLLRAGKDATVFLKDCDKILFAYLDDADAELDDEAAEGRERENEKPDDTSDAVHGNFQNAGVIEGAGLQWKEEMKKKAPLAIKLFVSKRGKEQELVLPIMAMY